MQPFYAREEEGFNELFQEIWRDLETPEEPEERGMKDVIYATPENEG
jgi:NitT/TauT family transport system ATP-binding protein